jgi:hypothetical protein
LLLCSDQTLPGTKYKIKQNIELTEAQVRVNLYASPTEKVSLSQCDDGSNLDFPDTFYIKTTDKVVELGFR